MSFRSVDFIGNSEDSFIFQFCIGLKGFQKDSQGEFMRRYIHILGAGELR